MTFENIMSQVGVGPKRLTERYSEYPAQVHDQQIYYAYDPSLPTHGFVHTGTKHNFGSGLKTNASMSALTLLAFLFFLHILQQCIKEHMNDLGASPIVVMTAGKEGEVNVAKSANKIDKSGTNEPDAKQKANTNDNRKSTIEKYGAKNPFQDSSSSNKKLMKVPLAEKTTGDYTKDRYEYIYKNYDNFNQSPMTSGYGDTNEDNW